MLAFALLLCIAVGLTALAVAFGLLSWGTKRAMMSDFPVRFWEPRHYRMVYNFNTYRRAADVALVAACFAWIVFAIVVYLRWV